jgi:hypothetical protein
MAKIKKRALPRNPHKDLQPLCGDPRLKKVIKPPRFIEVGRDHEVDAFKRSVFDFLGQAEACIFRKIAKTWLH